MIEFILNNGLLLDFIVRSSAILALGIVASYCWQRRPDRAHQLLLAAMLAAMVAPLACSVVRYQNWGLLPAAAQPSAVESVAQDDMSPYRPQHAAPLAPETLVAADVAPSPVWAEVDSPGEPTQMASAAAATPWWHRVDWRGWMLVAWCVASTMLIVRLAMRFVASRMLIAGCEPTADSWITSAVAEAAARVRLKRLPTTRRGTRVRSPMIWCWGRQATLLLPHDASRSDHVDWVAVFSHELAHLRRRDHMGALAADLLVALFPWNPVAFLCRRRLATLSELSCDDWAVLGGDGAVDYASSLLNLVPASQPSMALSIVSRNNLSVRIQRLLAGRFHRPGIGRRWKALVGSLLLATVAAVGLAQTRTDTPVEEQPGRLADQPVDKPVQTTEPAADAFRERIVRGSVVDPAGKPAANIDVYWLGDPSRRIRNTAARQERNLPTIYAQGKTDDRGNFELRGMGAPPNPSVESRAPFVVAIADGFGFGGKMVVDYDESLKIKLPKNLPIEGRILTPDGDPAAGVTVEINLIARLQQMFPPRGWGVRSRYFKDNATHRFPALRPTVTDADGRFKLDGLSSGGLATLTLTSDKFAPDEVSISAPGGLMSFLQKMKGPRTTKPKFTHTLEPGRIVKGTVIADDSNRPIANSLVELNVFGNRSTLQRETRTNAIGEFAITCGTGRIYTVRVIPEPNSEYLPSNLQYSASDWSDGTRPYVANLRLQKGRQVIGKIIDSEGKPVAEATIEYHPHGNNSKRTSGAPNPRVVSKQDGSFLIKCLPGQGFLVADAPSQTFSRQRVTTEQHRNGEDWYVHGVARLDISDDELEPVSIALSRGVTMQVKTVDTDGHPLNNVAVYYTGINSRLTHRWGVGGRIMSTANFSLPECAPDEAYRTFFVHSGKKLGAVAELTYNDGQETVVTLKPLGSINGRIITGDGTPVTNSQIIAMAETNADVDADSRGYFDRNRSIRLQELAGEVLASTSDIPRTDNEGRFRIAGVVPGAPVYVQLLSRMGSVNSSTVRIAAGEQRDLGDIRLEPIR